MREPLALNFPPRELFLRVVWKTQPMSNPTSTFSWTMSSNIATVARGSLALRYSSVSPEIREIAIDVQLPTLNHVNQPEDSAVPAHARKDASLPEC